MFKAASAVEAGPIKTAFAAMGTPATPPTPVTDEAIAKLKKILWSKFRATLIFMLNLGGFEPTPQNNIVPSINQRISINK